MSKLNSLHKLCEFGSIKTDDDLAKFYQPKCHFFPCMTTMTLAHVLTAHEDTTTIIKTVAKPTRRRKYVLLIRYSWVECFTGEEEQVQ